MRLCACGTPFRPRRKDQMFCSASCSRTQTRNKSRATRRASPRTFVACDGEGINFADGTHRYVMFSIGDDTIYEPRGLTYDRIFSHLYTAYRRTPYSAFIGFFLGYDFTQWLRGLPEETARLLFDRPSRTRQINKRFTVVDPVRIGGWEIDITAMKRFQLRPFRPDGKKADWLYVCDSGSYWQTSFLNAIDPKKWPEPVCTDEEYALLVAGKDARADKLTEADLDADGPIIRDMTRYNALENTVLARVMEQLAAGYLAVGIKPSRDSWYGPGGAAQAWLDSLETPSPLKREDVTKCVTSDAWHSAAHAYYGGHFQIFMHGHVPGLSYEYDLQSAYPDAIRNLPCLCQGLETVTDECDTPTFVHITAVGTNPVLGALPHRGTDGSILFPHEVEGWYPYAEVMAAQRLGLLDRLTMYSGLRVRQCDHPPPLALLTDLFFLRLKVGKNTPQGKAIKLLLNSVYGKFAQSVGAAKYGNPVYAALITSACRTSILHAISSHPVGLSDLVMIATDGVFFRSPHYSLDLTPNTLGAWEESTHTNLTVMKPGMYWSDASRNAIADGKITAIKSRGVSSKVLAQNIAGLDREFTDMTGEDSVPEITQTIAFSYRSPVQAIAQNKWHVAGVVQYDIPRKDSAQIGPKRTGMYRDSDVWRSLPGLRETSLSTPYKRDFGGHDVIPYR